MIQLYQKVMQLKILKHFFEFPTEGFYLRELARLLSISPMTVKRALEILVKDELVVKEAQKNLILYRSNMDNQAFRFAKVSYNLARLQKNNIVNYFLEKTPSISSIVLYGSYAKGENDRYSDLDLVIISTVKLTETSEINKKLGVDVNIMNFSNIQWTKQPQKNRPFYLDVITEGIVLYGTRPVVE